MKKLIKILPLVILFLTANFSFGQQPVNLLEGTIQSNKLPEGWSSGLEDNGRAEYKNGTINFERNAPDGRCMLIFAATVPDGQYTLDALYTVEGESSQIIFENSPMEKTNKINSVKGTLSFCIGAKSAGKVTGSFTKLLLSPAN